MLERACSGAYGRCSEPACGDGLRDDDDDDDDDAMTSGNSSRRLPRYTMIRHLLGPCQGLDTSRMSGAMATYLVRRLSGTTTVFVTVVEVHGRRGRAADAHDG